jgi:predicted TIM-barrel fold metal-dependent hydrolase
VSEIVDMHTHVWPDRIAKQAIGGREHSLDAVGDGTVSGLLAEMDRSGIDRSVVFGIAERPDLVDRANAFISSQGQERLIPFGTVHVGLSAEENLASLRRHRIKGVKIHPLFQGFALDDPRLIEILEAIGSELPVIAHVGQGGSDEANSRCTPSMIAELCRRVPQTRLIACHFGAYREFEQAEELLLDLPLYFDTSWPPTLADLDPDRVRRLIDRHGVDRIVFGSDWPMADPRAEVAAIRALGLRSEDETKILGANALRLCGVTLR